MKQSVDLQSFHEKLDRNNLGPLWASIHDLNTIEPKARPIPYLWKRELIEKHLEEAEDLLQVGDGADRRAVFLINPGMKDLIPYGWGGATHTLYAAVQAVKPGEIAPAHRHTTTALRFIMKGEGGSGRVNGEKIPFEPGDYLITPTWTWHDHTNQGEETIMWMDCLDVPFTLFMNVCFTEFYPEKQQELLVPDDYSSKRYQGGMVRPISDRTPSIAPLGRYKWELTKKGLDGLSEFEPDPFDGYAIEYINPSTGKDANNRIGARMQKLPPQFFGKAHRHVHSNVYHVFKGSGYTVMNGVKFEWSEGDFFVIPPWVWHEHVNLSETEDALLFSTNDLPIMEAFDFERKEEYRENGGSQIITEVFVPIEE
ncbi:cupin domain-containing protein [Brevibacillus nitrificans]|uniref:cupin domain-containing protein n=1 Tax=Brevibacillus nitrificans TaxID=651560 RepID=UPI002860ED51|nr:cupin domain-containing protein [Brevibacillus nitrificans]MDR7318847.1 gentisate 1,2-dioxygenase [Brevibacillus nitrificans]